MQRRLYLRCYRAWSSAAFRRVRHQAWDPAADEPADWGAVLALQSRQLRGRAPELAGATAGSAAALLQAAARGWLEHWRQQRAGWALRYLFRRWR